MKERDYFSILGVFSLVRKINGKGIIRRAMGFVNEKYRVFWEFLIRGKAGW